MATELLDLVSTTLPGLRDWLVANEKVFLQPVLSAQE
jgi:hypothetical protein